MRIEDESLQLSVKETNWLLQKEILHVEEFLNLPSKLFLDNLNLFLSVLKKIKYNYCVTPPQYNYHKKIEERLEEWKGITFKGGDIQEVLKFMLDRHV